MTADLPQQPAPPRYVIHGPVLGGDGRQVWLVARPLLPGMLHVDAECLSRAAAARMCDELNSNPPEDTAP